MLHATAPQIHSSVSAAQSDLMGLHRAAQASGRASVSSLLRRTAYSPAAHKLRAHCGLVTRLSPNKCEAARPVQASRLCMMGPYRDASGAFQPEARRILASFKQSSPPGTFILLQNASVPNALASDQIGLPRITICFLSRCNAWREVSLLRSPSPQNPLLSPCSRTRSNAKSDIVIIVT